MVLAARWYLAVLVLAAVLAGVGSLGAPRVEQQEAGAASSSVGEVTGEYPTFDEQLDRISEQVPEFAGLYLDRDVLVVQVTDGTDGTAVAAVEAAMQVLDDRSLATHRIRAVRTQFSWVQLRAWFLAVHNRLWQLDGVTMTDIDERTNRVTVGVADDKYEAGVRAAAEEAGMPPDALNVVHFEAVKALTGPASN